MERGSGFAYFCVWEGGTQERVPTQKKDRMLVPKKVHTLEPHNNTHFGVHSDISAIKEGVIMYNEVAV